MAAIALQGPHQAAQAQQLAARLEERAREHKSAVRHHRRQLKACMEELRELQRVCGQLGITLAVADGGKTNGVEETHGQASSRAQHQ